MTPEAAQEETVVPTLIEVWAPWCSACHAIESDVVAVSEAYQGRVVLQRVDAATDRARTAELGVMGTPSFIGMSEGTEVFRRTGRQSREGIEAMFEALANESDLGSHPRYTEPILTMGAGGLLFAAATLTGPSLPLAIIGGSLVLIGAGWWLRRRLGD